MDICGNKHRMLRLVLFNVVQLLLGLLDFTRGHGRLWEPPSRSSMWRRGYNTTININDNELSCGGFTNQWVTYRGLCGVCGDPYQQYPRDNEIGGKYASGIITRTYAIGGTIDVTIGLTANHMGYFEFKLCPIIDPAIGETQYCMDKHQLKIVNGEDNGYKFYIRDQNLDGSVNLTLQLPRNFLCKHCVLQWKYRTGTRWGCDSNLKCGKGKGPQEEFYGCSDISIQDVSKTVYNEPDVGMKAREGHNDLGVSKAHTVIWSIEPTQSPRYHTSKFVTDDDIVLETHTPTPLRKRHNKHMATLRHFLEELTLNALYSYYGKTNNNEALRCRPTVKYEKNPIVSEFCRRICTHDFTVCPDILCKCSQNAVNVVQRQTKNYQRKYRKLDRNHLKNFARKLIMMNRLVEKIPTDVTETRFRSNKDKYESERRQTSIPRLGRMEVLHHSKTRIPFTHSDRQSTKALQETNFLPFYDVKHPIGNRHLPNFMTSKGLELSSEFDPDKIVHFPPQEVIKPKIMLCTASIGFAHNPFMAKWCNTNCPFGFCPASVCSCNY